MNLLLQLRNNEKKIFLSSVPIIQKNIEFFVLRFYHYFLLTDAKHLFDSTNMDNQFKMFQTAIDVILAQVVDPEILTPYMQKISNAHGRYGVTNEQIIYFKESFAKAIQEVFPSELDKPIQDVWYKVLSEILTYFQNNLHSI